MFKTIEALDYSSHKDLRLTKLPSFKFAENISAVKLSFSEFRAAARFYPIVFLADAPGVPQALLSLEAGKNAFVNEDGVWQVPYVPVFFRLYPFTLAKIEEKKDQFALCLDPEAQHFAAGMGDPLFTADGKPTDFIQNAVLKNLQSYQQELETTQALFNVLEENKVICDREFKFTVNQDEKSIGGFRGVDMEKLMALEDAALAQLVKNGTLGLVHEHTNSLANIANFISAPKADPMPKGQ